MADGISIDASELHALSTHLSREISRLIPEVDAIMKKGADNVKKEMVEDASESTYFGGIARAISYDRAYGLGSVGYEVGVDRDRGGQAPLAGVAYFGGANGGGGTLDIDKPLRSEEPRLLKALGDLGESLL